MKLRILLGTAAALCLCTAAAIPADAHTIRPASRDTVSAGFVGVPNGLSVFTEKRNGSIQTNSTLYGLVPGQRYFTVVYPNTNCDPVAAFPVGPFQANYRGVATLDKRTPNPKKIDLSTTRSSSVRLADANGKVIAVPGSPAIGLVQCNATPTVFNDPQVHTMLR